METDETIQNLPSVISCLMFYPVVPATRFAKFRLHRGLQDFIPGEVRRF